jgi:hypothetical protein
MATEYEPLKFVGKGASWLFERKNMNQSLLCSVLLLLLLVPHVYSCQVQ